jgi:hypothetical protein
LTVEAAVTPETISAATRPAPSTVHCGRGVIIVIPADRSEVVVVPLRCKLWSCERCRPYVARKWAERIETAQAERFLTLTLDPARFRNPWQAFTHASKSIGPLFRKLRAECGPQEYCLVWEVHQSGWPHLHILQKGEFIPQKKLSAIWDQLGCGKVVDIRRVRSGKAAAVYVTKYLCKGLPAGTADCITGRRIRASRGFFPAPPPQEKLDLEPSELKAFAESSPAAAVEELQRVFGLELVLGTPGDSYHFRWPAGPLPEELIAHIKGHFAGLPIDEVTPYINPDDW